MSLDELLDICAWSLLDNLLKAQENGVLHLKASISF